MLPGVISAIVIASLLGVGSLYLGHHHKKRKNSKSKRTTYTLETNEPKTQETHTLLNGEVIPTNPLESYEEYKKKKDPETRRKELLKNNNILYIDYDGKSHENINDDEFILDGGLRKTRMRNHHARRRNKKTLKKGKKN